MTPPRLLRSLLLAGAVIGSSAPAAAQVAFAWGDNTAGQLGTGTTTSSSVPVAVTGLDGLTVARVAAGAYSSFALTDTGRLFAWGENTSGQTGIGDATTSYFATPQEVLAPAGQYWSAVSVGADGLHVVAVLTPVPEPATVGLLAAGLVAAGLARRRRVVG